VSSTTTTLTFARASRANAALAGPLAFGTAASNAMLYPRVLVALAVLNPSLVASVAMLLVPPWLVAIGATVIGVGRGTGEAAETREPDNPLALTYALQMAVSFQFVRMVLHVVQQSWGQAGVVASAALLGLTDVDALTASMARSAPATMPMNSAAIGIAVGVLANTILKLVMAAVFGSAPFVRFAAASLGLMGLASLAALLYASWG